MAWRVVITDEVADWLAQLQANDPKSSALVIAAIDRLEDEGPTLGRPLVDRVKDSRHHNMKELRPGSAGSTELRILFAFDPRRQAVLLVAGDKSGDWTGWYSRNLKLADDRFDEYLRSLT